MPPGSNGWPRSARLTPTSSDIARLANAVASRSTVQYLRVDEAGRKQVDGYGSIEDAAYDGRAFMVMPSSNTLAIDADTPDQISALVEVASEIRDLGIVPVRIHSGRGQHLFARMAPGFVAEWARRGEGRGLDVRRRTPIRPPLSPHPAGLPVGLADLTLEQAIEALTSLPAPTKRLSRRMYLLLAHGEGMERYASGSEAVQAVATACVNVGLSRNWFHEALTNPGNLLADVAARHEPTEAWLDRSWQKAIEFVQAHPLPDAASGLLDVIEGLDAMSQTLRKMTSAILAAHMQAAVRAGSPVHLLGVDQCAIDAGASANTVRTHRRLLEHLGVLSEVEKGGGSNAGVWKLHLPENEVGGQTCTPTYSHPPGDEQRGASLCNLDFGADAFRHGVLNKTGPYLVEILRRADRPMSAPAIADLMPGNTKPWTVRRGLRRMKEQELVRLCHDGWFLIDGSPEALGRVAEAHGRLGKRTDEIERLEADRAWRKAIQTLLPIGPPQEPGPNPLAGPVGTWPAGSDSAMVRAVPQNP